MNPRWSWQVASRTFPPRREFASRFSRWRFHRWQRIFLSRLWMIHIAKSTYLLNHFLCYQFWRGEGSQDVSKHVSAGCPSAQATRPFKVEDLAKVSHHPAFCVDVTRIKPAHFRRSNSTLASFSGMVWTITTDFDLHNTSSNIAKLHVHSEFKVEFGEAHVEQQRFVKKEFRFLHDWRKLHKDTSKRAMRLEPNRIFAVNLRHLRLIFIDLYCRSNWNSRKEST